LLLTLTIAFVSFPFLFVFFTWRGESEGLEGFLAAGVLMFFIQFISPFHLWVMPLIMGSLAALLLRLANMAPQRRP
jgi:hypothetical protein